ncbi:hypothetical protein VTK56DRAFT_6088 [Thermocarpiscus australiensis]
MASISTLLAHMNQTEIPRYRKSLPVTCSACTHEGQVGVKPMSIWEWLTHARAVHKWALPGVAPCTLYGHLYAPGPGLRRHFTTRHSDKLGEQSESAARLASAMPAGEIQGIHEFEELLQQSRRRDGDVDGKSTAPAAKRTKVDGDGGCPAPAARRTESDGNRECPAPSAKRARAARHNVAYKKELSPVVLYDAGSDLLRPWILIFLGTSTPPFSLRGGQPVPPTTLPRYSQTFKRKKRSGGRSDAVAAAMAK